MTGLKQKVLSGLFVAFICVPVVVCNAFAGRQPSQTENEKEQPMDKVLHHSVLIAFEWKGPPQFKQFMNNADPLTHVVVFFIPCSNETSRCTEVHVIHSGWRSSEEWEKAGQFFEKAWDKELEELRQFVNKERSIQVELK